MKISKEFEQYFIITENEKDIEDISNLLSNTTYIEKIERYKIFGHENLLIDDPFGEEIIDDTDIEIHDNEIYAKIEEYFKNK